MIELKVRSAWHMTPSYFSYIHNNVHKYLDYKEQLNKHQCTFNQFEAIEHCQEFFIPILPSLLAFLHLTYPSLILSAFCCFPNMLALLNNTLLSFACI